MKTTSQSTRSFPKPVKFFLYLTAVAVFCFFNWVTLQAQGPEKSLENRLTAALVEEIEAEIEIQDWMLTFSEDVLATEGNEIELESWMLTVSQDFIADREPEMELEPWMLSFSDDHLANGESELCVEGWMTDTFLWGTAYMFARK